MVSLPSAKALLSMKPKLVAGLSTQPCTRQRMGCPKLTVRASTLSLTFAGRNLGTWTKYSGLDPEVNVLGQDNLGSGDFLTQPQVRYFITRLNLTF